MPDFIALFSQLYGRNPKGSDPTLIDDAEARLGVALPAALHEFYKACGAEPSVTTSHNRLRPPGRLKVVDGRVLFCEENQGVCQWGFVPGAADPIVEQGALVSVHELEWHPEEVSLSRFLEMLVYLQTAWGGFEYAGDLNDPTPVMSTIEAEWDVMVRHHEMTIYGRPGALISVFDGQTFVIGAARTEELFEATLGELGFGAL